MPKNTGPGLYIFKIFSIFFFNLRQKSHSIVQAISWQHGKKGCFV